MGMYEYVLIVGVPSAMMIIAIVFACVWGHNKAKELRTKIDYFNSIQIGDSKEDVIARFGNNYSRQIFKNNIEKYTWTLRAAQSSGYSYKGASSRVYSGVKKIYVKFKEDKVIETNGINLE